MTFLGQGQIHHLSGSSAAVPVHLLGTQSLMFANHAGSCGEQADPTLPVPSATVPLSTLCPSTSCPDKPASQSPWELSQKILGWIFAAWEGPCPCMGMLWALQGPRLSRGFACSPWPQQQWKCVSEGRASSCFAFPAHKAKAKTKPTQGWLNPQGQDFSLICFILFFLHHPSQRVHTKQFWSLATLKGTQGPSEPPRGLCCSHPGPDWQEEPHGEGAHTDLNML